MLRSKKKFPLQNPADFLRRALAWAEQFPSCCLLNNNGIPYPGNAFPVLLAADSISTLSENTGQAFDSLKKYYTEEKDYLFGFFGYDLKNELEDLKTTQPDPLGFPDLFFFRPRHLLFFENDMLIIESTQDPDQILQEIMSFPLPLSSGPMACTIRENIGAEEYLNTVKSIKEHLLEGDIYEINYCMEFFIQQIKIVPGNTYWDLNRISPMPFSSFMKVHDNYVLCASPERFLKKENNELLSQPIKGTRKRGSNEGEDAQLKKELSESSKEIAENMMIVDLVRNDLARSSEPGSVKADELFGIYSFAQVHQMISSISSQKKEDVHFIDVIKNAFPMGSMTGAPKISAMKLIGKYEKSRRGVFSGALGFIDPHENFDFNVVIRSILYNASSGYLSFQAGSAITYDSDPRQEYEECLLKASAIRKIFSDR